MAIVTVDDLKDHLEIVGALQDAKMARLRDQAESIILDYLRKTEAELLALNGGILPPLVNAAACLVAGELFANRETADPLNKGVRDILARWRDPVMA